MKLDLVIDIAAALEDRMHIGSLARMRSLETLLARGDVLDAPDVMLDRCLIKMFGYDPAALVPSAALLALGEGIDPGSDYWLRADPVCLTPTGSELTLSELPDDALTLSEAQALSATLGAHFATDNCTLLAPHPQRWYLRVAGTAEIHAPPPADCVGTVREWHLPTGPGGGRAKRMLTEAQMLLHAHPVNAAREAAGEPLANAIWLWGGGRLPVLTGQPRYQIAWGDDPLVRALARASGVAAQALPRDAAELIANPPAASGLVLLRAIGTQNLRSLAGIERTWFEVLLAAIRNGRLSELSLTLMLPGGPIVRRVVAAHMRRWWRRARALSAYA